MDSDASTVSAPEDNLDSDPHDEEFPKLFYVNDLNSVDAVIRSFEYKTNSKFAVVNTSSSFGYCLTIPAEHVNRNIMFVDKIGDYESIPYDGEPYFVIGQKTLGCKFGLEYMAKHLKKRRARRKQRGSKAQKKLKTLFTKCPARIYVREVLKFPKFKIENNIRSLRDIASYQLAEALKKGEAAGERRFYICLPRLAEHKGHELLENVNGVTDRSVVQKLHELMNHGISDSERLQKDIFEYVRNELFKGTEVPPETDCRFFPSKKRIYSMRKNWRKRKRNRVKQNEGVVSTISGEMLSIVDDPTSKESDRGGDKAAGVSVGGKGMDGEDEGRLQTSHEQISVWSASAMNEFNSNLKGCNILYDHIKNLLVLSGDKRVAGNVKKRLGNIIEELENNAKSKKKKKSLIVEGTSDGVGADLS